MEKCKVKIVSKEFRDKRISEKIPLWEGYIMETPSPCYQYIIVTLFNKYRPSDFYETFKYKYHTKK
jgi:hypothetical protein